MAQFIKIYEENPNEKELNKVVDLSFIQLTLYMA